MTQTEELVKISLDMPKPLADALVAQAEREDSDKAKIIRKAVRMYLATIDQPSASPVQPTVSK